MSAAPLHRAWKSVRGARAILFDLGGTVLSIDHPRIERLLRSAGHVPPAGWAARAERAGRRAVDGHIREGATSREQWEAFFHSFLESAGTPPELLHSVFAEIEDFHRRQHLWNRPINGVPDAIAALGRAGYRIAAVSNSDGRAEWLLGTMGLSREFEFVIDSHDVGIEKPDPRIFHLACERLGLAPPACAYVGDVLQYDVEGARRAGLRAVLLDHYGSYETADLPDDVPRAVEASELPAGFGPAPAREEASS